MLRILAYPCPCGFARVGGRSGIVEEQYCPPMLQPGIIVAWSPPMMPSKLISTEKVIGNITDLSRREAILTVPVRSIGTRVIITRQHWRKLPGQCPVLPSNVSLCFAFSNSAVLAGFALRCWSRHPVLATTSGTASKMSTRRIEEIHHSIRWRAGHWECGGNAARADSLRRGSIDRMLLGLGRR